MSRLDEEIEDARAFAMRHPVKWWQRPASSYVPEWVIPVAAWVIAAAMLGACAGVLMSAPGIVRDWDARRDCVPIVIGAER